MPHPEGSALRLVEPRSTRPQGIETARYVRALYPHCPFLETSVRRGSTRWTVYAIEPGAGRHEVEAGLFHAAVGAAERIRRLARHPDGRPACENIAFLGAVVGADDHALMAWPHWALKHVYGPVGLMFGKFAKGVRSQDRRGRNVPPSPFSFLAVRASIRQRDPGLLRSTPGLAATLSTAEDDGRNVFAQMPCEWKAVREWATSSAALRKR